MPHPFNRYSKFTDVNLLKEASEKPLRKSLRVNTLKMSVKDFKEWAKERGWEIEPVPWCNEGFFIDRESREEALGKDLLHLLGNVYMQEAASMLPVELLDPQPGETILDLSAAPGSKSTQIVAKMGRPTFAPNGAMVGKGVLVANDMKEKRLWTLNGALQRSGTVNAILINKLGQWYGKHMTERFDRVLIDAPCTAQGTLRKDPSALTYTSENSIGKAAKLQRELLEAAIHATKVGGRIVYSTCTLTPEENEEVVMSLLNKFSVQLEVIDPRQDKGHGTWDIRKAIEDSEHVQQKALSPLSNSLCPFIRIWPQTYNTEGFFCAVLEKKAPTREVEHMDIIKLKGEIIRQSQSNEIINYLEKHYGIKFIEDQERLILDAKQFFLTTQEVLDFKLPTKAFAVGLPFGKVIRDQPVYLSNEVALLRGSSASKNVSDIDDQQLKDLLKGKNVSCDENLLGHVLIRWRNFCIGKGRSRSGKLKNQISRWMINSSQ